MNNYIPFILLIIVTGANQAYTKSISEWLSEQKNLKNKIEEKNGLLDIQDESINSLDGFNQLSTLGIDPASIKRLVLSVNPLEQDATEQPFAVLKNLEKLELDETKYRPNKNSFIGLSNLTYLDLSGNSLGRELIQNAVGSKEKIAPRGKLNFSLQALYPLTQLKELKLSNNNLYELPDLQKILILSY